MHLTLTKKELISRCKEKGIPGVSKLNKFELMALLSIDSDPFDQQPLDQEPFDQEPLDQQPLANEPLDQQPLDTNSQDDTLEEIFVFNPCKRLFFINMACCLIYSLYYIRF